MEHAVLQDIVESVSAADSVSELSVIQLSDSALSGGVPPPLHLHQVQQSQQVGPGTGGERRRRFWRLERAPVGSNYPGCVMHS